VSPFRSPVDSFAITVSFGAVKVTFLLEVPVLLFDLPIPPFQVSVLLLQLLDAAVGLLLFLLSALTKSR